MDSIGTGFNSLIGTRQSTANPGTAEYYNTQTNQGFSDPTALSSFVNQNFTGVNTNPTNVFSTLSTGYQAPKAISADTLNQPTKADNFSQPTPTPVPNIDSLFTTPEITATLQDQQLQAIFDQQQALNNQLVGQSAYQNQANDIYGVNKASQTINDLNSQLIQTKNDQAAIPLLLQQSQSSKGIAQPLIDRQQNYLLQQNAIRALGISSLMAAAQGQLANAQSLADKAVSAKYDPIKEQLAALENNAQLIQNSPNYTIAQKNQAQKVQDAAAKQRYQVNLAEQNQQDIYKVAVDAASKGIDATTLQKIQSAPTALQAVQYAAEGEKQLTNQKLAKSNNVTTPVVNNNGEFFDTKTGKTYSTPQEFFSAVGVHSFEEAYAKGLVTDVKATPDLSKLPASYQEYLLAKKEGYKGDYNAYQTMDANRKAVRTTTNNITYNQQKDQNQEADIKQTNLNLKSVAGKDGYVNVNDWKRAYNDWIEAGHTAKEFIDNFGGYVNPNSKDPYFGVK